MLRAYSIKHIGGQHRFPKIYSDLSISRAYYIKHRDQHQSPMIYSDKI